MRIVVTGAAGFVGSHVAEALIAAGHEVVGIDAFIDYYPRALKEDNLAQLQLDSMFRLCEVDLRTALLEPVLEGAEVVIHEAAMAGLPRSWTEFETYLTCNVLGTHRLLEAARAVGVRRFLHISTSSVYGLEAVGDERRPTRPISPYGVTKLAAENLVQAFVDTSGLDASILRYFSIFGPRQRPDMAYSIFIEALLSGQPITVFGDGEQSRTNTFVSDAVAGTIAAIDGAATGEIYNIGGGEPITVNEAIRTVAEFLGVTPDLRYEAARTGDQRHTSADTAKARAAFGYTPSVGPREGLIRQARWQSGRRRRALSEPDRPAAKDATSQDAGSNGAAPLPTPSGRDAAANR
jgi:nucleoside-diphosphate-sugar epimerase